jgi:hypothetical protein
MKLLLVFFLPWAYFFTVGRPVAGSVHLIVWLMSIPLLFVFGLGMLIWGIQVTMAMWDLRKQLHEEQAAAIATRMAAELKAQGSEPPRAA